MTEEAFFEVKAMEGERVLYIPVDFSSIEIDWDAMVYLAQGAAAVPHGQEIPFLNLVAMCLVLYRKSILN